MSGAWNMIYFGENVPIDPLRNVADVSSSHDPSGSLRVESRVDTVWTEVVENPIGAVRVASFKGRPYGLVEAGGGYKRENPVEYFLTLNVIYP